MQPPSRSPNPQHARVEVCEEVAAHLQAHAGAQAVLRDDADERGGGQHLGVGRAGVIQDGLQERKGHRCTTDAFLVYQWDCDQTATLSLVWLAPEIKTVCQAALCAADARSGEAGEGRQIQPIGNVIFSWKGKVRGPWQSALTLQWTTYSVDCPNTRSICSACARSCGTCGHGQAAVTDAFTSSAGTNFLGCLGNASGKLAQAGVDRSAAK
jgi:hypothetical protein